MERHRTVPIQLAVDPEQAALLQDTIKQFQWAVNFVVDLARAEEGSW